MAREATSIYIDNSSIRVLTLRGKQAQKWGTIPLEPGLVKDGVIIDKDTVTSKIKELWRKEKIGSHRVIAGINGINCFYRFLSLPELPRNLLDEAAMREARRALGVPVEQLHLSWQVLPSPKGETRIYLVAAQRSSVDTLISVLRRAGLTPYLMDLAPLGLARTTTEPRAIMVDLQPRNLDIVVRIEGIPEVIRSVPLSREAVLEEKVPIVRDEVHRAITFYNSSHADKPIDTEVPLLVCGELAEREDVWKLVTGRQKRPVQVLPPPVEDVKDFSACRYMINIGLAFKEVLGSRKEASAYLQVNFNALPQTYIPKRHPISDLLFIPITIAGIALVAFG
ncbi:MAG: pilus assembly protein PilM, partial [Chloroflexota bacterium]|nr:pilus assembly protein PilM [Chloroflexota bacterium]